MYKARLAASFRFDESEFYPHDVPSLPSFGWLDPEGRWRTVTERDTDKRRGFEAELEYPEFRHYGVEPGPLNELLREKMHSLLRRFRDEAVYGPAWDHYPPEIGFEISSSFAVALLNSNLASIRFTVHAYAGGAHGSTSTDVVNAFLDPFKSIGLADVFTNVTMGSKILSRYCKSALMNRENQNYVRDEQWVSSGAGPEEKNFARFNVMEQGLLINFDEYQIDCYAAGRSEVLVPYAEFAGSINDQFRKRWSPNLGQLC